MDVGRTRRILARGLKLKCPDCGLQSLFESPFRMRASCDYCDLIFEREQGYFVGAIYINVIATEGALLLTLLIYGLIAGTVDQRILSILFVLALALPLLLYHHSRRMWLSVDHLISPSDKRITRELDSSE